MNDAPLQASFAIRCHYSIGCLRCTR